MMECEKNIDSSECDKRHYTHTSEQNREKMRQLVQAIKSRQEKYNARHSRSTLSKSSSSSELFRNRYESQKKIIETQQTKLKEQEKIINQLKFGIIAEEIQDCSKAKMKLIDQCFKAKDITKLNLLSMIPFEEREQLRIKTLGAPRILKEIEEKSLKRMEHREMIREKKRLLEEAKSRIRQEAMERKRCLEEQEKARHLEIIREQRKEELRKQMIRQKNKEEYLTNLNRAVNFHQRNILTTAFSRWKFEYKLSLLKAEKSKRFYTTNLIRKSFEKLRQSIYAKEAIKNRASGNFYKNLLLRKAFKIFQKNHFEGVRAMQVAEDYRDLKLQIDSINRWKKFVERTKILNDIKVQQALHHFRKRLTFQCFHKWRSLPLVNRLEKAKEARKEKWRRKVLEILPDFSPVEI